MFVSIAWGGVAYGCGHSHHFLSWRVLSCAYFYLDQDEITFHCSPFVPVAVLLWFLYLNQHQLFLPILLLFLYIVLFSLDPLVCLFRYLISSIMYFEQKNKLKVTDNVFPIPISYIYLHNVPANDVRKNLCKPKD